MTGKEKPMTVETESDRGQAYVLEGVIGVLVITLALVLGMQVVDIAPWADSTDQRLDEASTEAADVLEIAQNEGMLDEIAACVAGQATSESNIIDREENQPTLLTPVDPGTGFERLLNSTLEESARYSVIIEYPDPANPNGTTSTPLTLGSPAETASRAAATRVPLSDTEDILGGADCTRTGDTLADGDPSDNFYFADQSSSELYGVVTIRVVVW